MSEDEEFVADFDAAYQRSHPTYRATGTDADGNRFHLDENVNQSR